MNNMDNFDDHTENLNGTDNENDNIDDVLIALTQWTRSVMQSLPPLQPKVHQNETNHYYNDSTATTNNTGNKDEEWEYEQSFPEFQTVLSETKNALGSLRSEERRVGKECRP